VRSWAKPLSHVRLHVQLQLHVCLHGAIVAAIASCKHRITPKLAMHCQAVFRNGVSLNGFSRAIRTRNAH